MFIVATIFKATLHDEPQGLSVWSEAAVVHIGRRSVCVIHEPLNRVVLAPIIPLPAVSPAPDRSWTTITGVTAELLSAVVADGSTSRIQGAPAPPGPRRRPQKPPR